MSAELRVFVSHSSDDNESLVEPLLPLLRAGLSEAWDGAEVLVDLEKITFGDLWRERINRMLWQCNSALLLLTERVLKRPDWVRREVNFVSVRRETDPSFKLWIAREAGVTDAALEKAGFGPAQLGAAQQLRLPLSAENLGALVTHLCGSVPQLKQARAEREPVAEHLERLLSTDAARALCRDMAKRLQLQEVPTSWGADQAEAIAAATARGIVARRLNRLDIGALLKDIFLGDEHRRHLVDWLAPLWVRRERAERLLPYAPAGGGQDRAGGTLAIPGKLIARFTGEMYVRRAFGISDAFEICRVPIAAGGDTFGGIRDSICAWARDMGYVYSNLEKEAIVSALETFDQPIFVALETAPDAATCSALRAAFPGVLFLCPPPLAAADADADVLTDPAADAATALTEITLDADEDPGVYESTEQLEYNGWRTLRKPPRTAHA